MSSVIPTYSWRLLNRSLADHSQALPSPPDDSSGRCGGSIPWSLLHRSSATRGERWSPRSAARRTDLAARRGDDHTRNRGCGTGTPAFRCRARPATNTSRRVRGRSRCSPVRGVCYGRRTRPSGRAGADLPAVRGPGPRDWHDPSGAAAPLRGDTGVGGARRPRPEAVGRGRCRSW